MKTEKKSQQADLKTGGLAALAGEAVVGSLGQAFWRARWMTYGKS